MGLGDFLNSADKWIEDRIAGGMSAVGVDSYKNYLADQQPTQQQEHPAFWKAPTTAAATAMGIASQVPGFDQAMTYLDYGRRAADTMLITAKHAGAVSKEQANGADSVAWGELLNRDNWSRAWDSASFDNPNRVTGGQIIAGQAFGHNDRIEIADPFAAKDAVAIQQAAQGTWYGKTSSALVDLGTSFIAPPGLGVAAKGAKAARAAKTIDSAATAETAALRLRDNGIQSVPTSAPTVAQKAKDTLDVFKRDTGWVNATQDVDSVLHRQMVGLRDFDGITDQSKMMDLAKTRMENAADGDLANITNVFTEINKAFPLADEASATMRDKLRMNYFLSAFGSKTAREEFIKDAPLIARNAENLTTAVREPQAMSELYAARLHRGEDIPVNEVIDRVYGTAADKAEEQALKDSLESLASEAKDARSLWQEVRSGKPSLKNLDAEMLKRSRSDANAHAQRLQQELMKARDDLRGTKRWAAGAVKRGDMGNVADFHTALGDARARVTELEQRLAQARADRDLLHQTPLPGGMVDQADYAARLGDAQQGMKQADANRNWQEAFLRNHQASMKAKQADIRALRPGLNRANDLLNDILDVVGDAPSVTLTGGAEPTLLGALKQNVRDRIGAEHYVVHGDGNTVIRARSLPSRAARMALAPQARGSISLAEVDLGRRQLADTLSRSGHFTRDEIQQAQNLLLQKRGADRAGVVASYQTKMLERMATDFFAKKGLNLAPEDALRRAKEITSLVEKHHGKGNHWVSRKADEQIKDKIVTLKDEDGLMTAFDAPMLRSHLADNAPIIDPWDFKRLLESHEKTIVGNIRNGLGTTMHLHDMAMQAWKVGALLRPGLMVRSMLDTGPRMLASLDAASTLMSTMNGAANLIHNKALTGLAKLNLGGLSIDEAAAKARYLGLKPVEVRDPSGKLVSHQFAMDQADLQTKLQAASKGNTVHGALFHDMNKAYDGLQVDRSKWARRKADSDLWHVAYKEYAGMLLASPTARKLAEMMTTPHAGQSIDDLRRSIKNSPEFKGEYAKFAQPMGRTREEFLSHVMHEVELMFPSEKILAAAKNGGLSKKLLDEELPQSARFDIPSPELSAFEGIDGWKRVKAGVDKTFRLLLDKPDMWLARNPTAVMLYNKAVKREYGALRARFGGDYEVTPEMMKAIDRRARNESIGYVRRTFFDTTRNTGAHRYVSRISPFFMAWEDAMMSWGRLIADDPRRLVKLNAAYHVPYTIADSTGNSFVVDQSGQPVGRGDHPDAVFVQIPHTVIKALGKIPGVDTTNVRSYRMRLDAMNSIFQGETWWLPGVGPTVSVPAAYALGSGKVISREAALDLVETDNWFGKQVLKSMYLGGELPPSDAKSLATSTTPGWLRNLFSETMGTGKVRNRQTTFNYLVAEAMANGKPLDDKTYADLWARADKAANAAAITRLVAGGGLGLTGSAAVDGQFYADQMHIIQAMTPEMRNGKSAEEYFAEVYPEAADLDWSITKNETGIVASVRAAKGEARLGSLLNQPANQKVGWMILGADNMVDTEFSRTAYGMQRAEGNRVYLSPQEAQQEAQSAVGYRQYDAYLQQAKDALGQYGLDENSDQFKAVKGAVTDYLMQTNPAWAKAHSERFQSFDYYYSQAQRLSQSGQLAKRSDMALFRDYDTARVQVMKQFGIKSLSGTGPEYVAARALLKQAGDSAAARDFGFQQMWNRFLSSEVEEG